jgi:multicomponent Na+:H+ antiporter subunit A
VPRGSAFEWAVAGLMILTAISVVIMPTRLGAVVALGLIGYLMAFVFVLYSGPDLALTQLLVESLTVILLLLVFYFLPQQFKEVSTLPARARDIAIAAGVGFTVTVLVLLALPVNLSNFSPTLAEFFLEQSVPGGFGYNVVNVILVDFRSMDTLGEVVVLVIAALSVYGLIQLRPPEADAAEMTAPLAPPARQQPTDTTQSAPASDGRQTTTVKSKAKRKR